MAEPRGEQHHQAEEDEEHKDPTTPGAGGGKHEGAPPPLSPQSPEIERKRSTGFLQSTLQRIRRGSLSLGPHKQRSSSSTTTMSESEGMTSDDSTASPRLSHPSAGTGTAPPPARGLAAQGSADDLISMPTSPPPRVTLARTPSMHRAVNMADVTRMLLAQRGKQRPPPQAPAGQTDEAMAPAGAPAVGPAAAARVDSTPPPPSGSPPPGSFNRAVSPSRRGSPFSADSFGRLSTIPDSEEASPCQPRLFGYRKDPSDSTVRSTSQSAFSVS